MRILDSIELMPILHGRITVSKAVRRRMGETSYDALLLPLPSSAEEELLAAVEDLPLISAVTIETDEAAYIIPADPCDAFIEGIRQAGQQHLAVECLGSEVPSAPVLLPSAPDEEAIERIGYDQWATLTLHSAELREILPEPDEELYHLAAELHKLAGRYERPLLLMEIHRIPALLKALAEPPRELPAPTQYLTIRRSPVKIEKLYFMLSELPFVTASYEMNRAKLFEEELGVAELIKRLFLETRDNYISEPGKAGLFSLTRLQQGLTFLRNLTIQEGDLTPSLFNMIIAAKGVGGDSFALKVLRAASDYPYLPLGYDAAQMLSIGLSPSGDLLIKFKGEPKQEAVNLLKDKQLSWRTVTIKPDKENWERKKGDYRWSMEDLCSHVPEDIYIENFNQHVRSKAMKLVTESQAKSEEFDTSFKDGLDIRETLRNWHTGKIYVKELPRVNSGIDTMIMIFDEDNDENYPLLTTWYAEHQNESTLSFYARDPFGTLIGPGVAESAYGGFALLFPAKQIPDVAHYAQASGIDHLPLSFQLTIHSMTFSDEKIIAYVAGRKPAPFLKRKARELGKQLLHIPLSGFSTETLRKLRKFHMLDGKKVRGWAQRYIGD